MEKLNGYNIPFDISQLKLRANLIEQDGPLLSLYYNDNGDYYLFYWLDCDDTTNRWMVIRVGLNILYQYLHKERTLLQVIESPSDSFVWVIDLDSTGNQTNTEAVPLSCLPLDYLPDKDSYFDFDNQQELLKDVSTDKVEIDIPKSDHFFFTALISKMGWQLSAKSLHKLIDKVAL